MADKCFNDFETDLKWTKARLDAIDAANECIIKRQTATILFIAGIHSDNTEMADKAIDEFNEANSAYTEKLKKIVNDFEEFNNGKYTESA